MLVKRFLTEKMRDELRGVTADCGFSLDDVIRSGMVNADSSIGLYAGDEDCYDKFSLLFDPIIESYHQYKACDKHVADMDYSKLGQLPPLDENNRYIVSTRVRVGRNVSGYALPAAISDQARNELEHKIKHVLISLEGEFNGSYYPLDAMSEELRQQLVDDHFLFKKGDRFLEAAGINRNWPHNRAIFHSQDKRFLVWVNEEDQLRIISMQQGGDIYQVFKRLVDAVTLIEQQLSFQFNSHLGYLSSCPTNLGTSLRASVHIRLPLFSQSSEFLPLCEKLQLSVRGIHGEHSDSENGIWDISNKRRLGLTEVDCIKTLHHGVNQLIEKEAILEKT